MLLASGKEHVLSNISRAGSRRQLCRMSRTPRGWKIAAACVSGRCSLLDVGDPVLLVGFAKLLVELFSWGAQTRQLLDFVPQVQACALDALAVASEHTPADVGIQCCRFDAKDVAGLLSAQELLAI